MTGGPLVFEIQRPPGWLLVTAKLISDYLEVYKYNFKMQASVNSHT